MIFRAAKDDRTDKISMKLFGKLLGEFERVNFVTECDKRIQYRYEQCLFEQFAEGNLLPRPEDPNSQKQEGVSKVTFSAESDGEEDDEEPQIP